MSLSRSLRGIGDRLFDARLYDVHGVAHTVFGDLAGAPFWMVHRTRPSLSLPAPPGDLRALCIGVAPPRPEPAWQSFGADPAWLATLPPDCVIELDANLRVRALHEVDDAMGVSAAPPPDTDLGAAPVLVVPEVLERELCIALVDHLRIDCAGGDESAVLVVEHGQPTLVPDAAIKLRRESPIRDPQLEARVHERLLRRALPEISRTLQFDVQRRDPFKLLSYQAGAGYFRPHRDNDTPDVAHRRFALSVNLNSAEYAGGTFRFPEFGARHYAPATGAALVFSCSLLHEVTPVERGTRYALTTFLA